MSHIEATDNSYRIDTDHPSLPGHFPGQPVVPGVVLLQEIIDVVEARNPEWRVAGIRKLKFLQPLLPDTPFAIEGGEIRDQALRIRCLQQDSGTLLAEGRLKLQRRGKA